MKAFALECCTETCSVAACIPEGDAWRVWSLRVHAPGQQLSRLVPLAQTLLADPALRDVHWDAVGVTRGPGTFTGLRIGLTTARTLAQVWDIPVVPVDTLDVVACNVAGLRVRDGLACGRGEAAGPVTVVLDARKGELFAARYDASHRGEWPRPSWGPAAVRPQALLAEGPVVGSGVRKLPAGAEESLWWPDAAHVALAAAGAYGALPSMPWAQVEAFYLRAADAEIPRFMREAG